MDAVLTSIRATGQAFATRWPPSSHWCQTKGLARCTQTQLESLVTKSAVGQLSSQPFATCQRATAAQTRQWAPDHGRAVVEQMHTGRGKPQTVAEAVLQ